MDFDIDMEDVATAPADVDNNVMSLGDEALLADMDDKEPGELDDPSAGGGAAAGAATDENPDTTLVPEKVHLRGLDTLTPDDIKAYLAEHLGSSDSSTRGSGGGAGVTAFRRIEWIDDSSANLVFADATSAVAAVCALAAVPLSISDASELPVHELLPAKPFVKSADGAAETTAAAIGSAESAATGLQVRFAVVSDRKQAGAAARSRFYLLHPEYDPEERRRNGTHRRGDDRGAVDSYRPGGGSGRQKRRYSGYRDDRDDRGDRGDDRDRDIRNNTFDASLYDDDDDGGTGASSAPRSARGGGQRDRRRRSWSRSRSRSRSRSPSESRAPWRESNRGKELFADDSGSGAVKKELFPEKLGNGGRLVSDDLAVERRGRERGGRNNRNRRQRNNRQRDLEYGRLRSSRSASPQRQGGNGFYYDEQGRGGGGSNNNDDDDDDYDGRLADARAEAAAAAAARNRDKARAIKERLAAAASNGHGADGTHAVTAQLRADDDSTFSIRGLAGEGSGGLDIKGSARARELFADRFHDGIEVDSSFAVRGQAAMDDGEGSSSRGGGGGGGRSSGAGRSLESRITRPRQRAKDLFQ